MSRESTTVDHNAVYGLPATMQAGVRNENNTVGRNRSVIAWHIDSLGTYFHNAFEVPGCAVET